MAVRKRIPRTKSAGQRWMERMWDKAMNEQYSLIKAEFGKHAADMANYGWGDNSDHHMIDIATKVYRHGVLTSFAQYPESTLRHTFEDF